VLLRHADHGSEVARSFFTPLAKHTELALRDFTADDLDTAHQVLSALIEAMRVFRTELRE
jgi:hypothetical protein